MSLPSLYVQYPDSLASVDVQCITCPTHPLPVQSPGHLPSLRVSVYCMSHIPRPPSPCSVAVLSTSLPSVCRFSHFPPSTIRLQSYNLGHLASSRVSVYRLSNAPPLPTTTISVKCHSPGHIASNSVSLVPLPPPLSPCSVTVLDTSLPSVRHLSHFPFHYLRTVLSPGHLASISASLVPLSPPLSPYIVKSWTPRFHQRASVSLVPRPPPSYPCSVTVLDNSLASVCQCIACPTVCHLSHVPLHHPRAVSLTQCVICPTSPSTIPMQCHTVCHLSHVPLHHPPGVSHSVSFVPRPHPPSPWSVTL